MNRAQRRRDAAVSKDAERRACERFVLSLYFACRSDDPGKPYVMNAYLAVDPTPRMGSHLAEIMSHYIEKHGLLFDRVTLRDGDGPEVEVDFVRALERCAAGEENVH